jgi:hypothetical protein
LFDPLPVVKAWEITPQPGRREVPQFEIDGGKLFIDRAVIARR